MAGQPKMVASPVGGRPPISGAGVEATVTFRAVLELIQNQMDRPADWRDIDGGIYRRLGEMDALRRLEGGVLGLLRARPGKAGEQS